MSTELQSIKDNLPTDQQALLDALFSKSVTMQKNAAKMRTSAAIKRQSKKEQLDQLIANLKASGQWDVMQNVARAKAEADLAAKGFTVAPAKYRRSRTAKSNGTAVVQVQEPTSPEPVEPEPADLVHA